METRKYVFNKWLCFIALAKKSGKIKADLEDTCS